MPAIPPRLIVEPDDGLEPVREFIATAQKSLLIKQFTYTEPTLIDAAIDRKKAGVDVRVMLNAQRSGGDRANDESFEQLKAAGIDVQWASPKFYVTHEKSIVVDEQGGHGGHLQPDDQVLHADPRLRDHHPRPRARRADRRRLQRRLGAPRLHPSHHEGLLWSNSNSRYHMARFIDTAERKLYIQHPKFVDAVILDRIAAAADRGVRVQVLCGGKHGISDWDKLDTFSSLRTLSRFGAEVRKQKNLRVHAKLLIVDGERVLVGSMNIDRSAFDLRRELGIMTDDPVVVRRLKDVFKSDWLISHHYEAPDPSIRPRSSRTTSARRGSGS